MERGHHNCAVREMDRLRIECFVLEALLALERVYVDQLNEELDTMVMEL